MDPFGLARFFAGQVLGTVAERTALREVLGRLGDDLIPGRDGDEDICDHDVQLELLRWRHEHVKASAARRLKAGMDAGTDPFEVLVDCQDHVLLVARSWADHLVADAFVRFVRDCEDPATCEVLGLLASLHALRVIEAERGWFQEHGKLSSTRSKAVVRGVNELCAKLRPHAAALVEGFGIPDECLGDAVQVATDTEGEPAPASLPHAA
jgi:acyl-CoA oxidase